MNIGAYIRVSSHTQKTDSQKAEVKKWLKGNGHNLRTVKWFEDRETGSTMKRAALNDLQAAIFSGDIKTVVVWKLDRLARSQQEGINVLYEFSLFWGFFPVV